MPALDSGRQAEIRGWIADEIERGTWKPGDHLPSVRELAGRFGCSITPVHRAVRQLAAAGRLSLRQGAPITVLAPVRPWVAVALSNAPLPGGQLWRGLETAAQDWLIHHLTQDAQVRVRLDPAELGLTAQLERALGDPPAVLVIAADRQPSAAARACALRLAAAQVSLVQWAGHDPLPGAHRVEGGFSAGMQTLTTAMLRRGARLPLRLAVAGMPRWERAKQAGFAEALRSAGHPRGLAERLTMELDGLPAHGADRIAWLAHALEQRCSATGADAVLAVNDSMVGEVRLALRRSGRGTLPVAGYDRSWRDLAAYLGGELYSGAEPLSVDRDLPEVGRRLARLAVDLAGFHAGEQPRVEVVEHRLHVPEAG